MDTLNDSTSNKKIIDAKKKTKKPKNVNVAPVTKIASLEWLIK